MSHSIQAFIAHKTVILKICEEWPDAVQLPLKQDFSLLPASPEFVASLKDKYAQTEAVNSSVNLELTVLKLFMTEQSKKGKIVWFKTSYSGGSGFQEAFFCSNQHLEGPYRTETNWNNIKLELVDAPKGIRAINKALYKLEVHCKYRDEFGALELPSLNSLSLILKKIKALKP
jgi:hypothetical protein